MKSVYAALCMFALLVVPSTAAVAAEKTSKNRAITEVVKLLEDMLEKSKTEGNTERKMYAKYKCYCDTNEREKTEEIESLTEEIAILEAKIEELQASNGELSSKAAKLKADMASNKQSQDDATTVRDKEKKAYGDLEADLTQAIGQMNDAIKTLSDIGADQSLGESAADHKYMMATPNALIAKKVHTQVKQALLAASAFVSTKHQKTVEAFLQAPFTGTYTAQSGEVVGILKDMRDTFKANLASATAAEEKAQEAYDKFMKNMQDAYDKMDAEHTEAQGILSANDGDLSTKKGQLSQAETDKADAEKFLAELIDMCEEKAKEYKNRVLLRTQEEAAIAEAISILNSDAAFATFGTVDATSTGATSFLQRASIRAHKQVAPAKTGAAKAQEFLASHTGNSKRIPKIIALLQAKNPFKTVLEEIKKMLDIIDEEQKADDEQLAWCKKERKESNDELDAKNAELDGINTDIDDLTTIIEDPKTGLKVQIETDETLLEENLADQKSETAQRTEDNLAYQKDIANLVEAEALLKKAISVLTKYYDSIAPKSSLIQKAAQPAPPSTWKDGDYEGQSADGNSAISMLEFILSETEKEQTTAHDDERTAQHAFEDSMDTLKTEQEKLIKNIAKLKEDLAQKEEELLGKKEDKKATEKVIADTEAYLEKIKPGCDFIVDNIDLRNTARTDEIAALNSATDLIKGTPAYMTAVAEAHNETLGDCKDICAEMTEDHVKCKACLADTSIPGYCAGHKGTMGC